MEEEQGRGIGATDQRHGRETTRVVEQTQGLITLEIQDPELREAVERAFERAQAQ